MHGLSTRQALVKRVFDVVVSAITLACVAPIIVVLVAISSYDTHEFGIFTQERVGRNARIFRIFKIRTMRTSLDKNTVTRSGDPRITRLGRVLRRYKLDELPQLVNVLRGDMSLVGPRPDVQGFADRLSDRERAILSLRPGITGPASIAFRDEESLLSEVADPIDYNITTLWPEKVKINLAYLENYSLINDIRYLVATFRDGFGTAVSERD